jgi:hypothetical protein
LLLCSAPGWHRSIGHHCSTFIEGHQFCRQSSKIPAGLRDCVTPEQLWFLHGVAPALNVTSSADRRKPLACCRGPVPASGVCSSSRSRECLRASMPSTFMPWASAMRPRSIRRVRTSIQATRVTAPWWGPVMPATCRIFTSRRPVRRNRNWSIRLSLPGTQATGLPAA